MATMLEQIVGSGGDGYDEDLIGNRKVKPALLTLLVDQAELLDASKTDNAIEFDLRSGFPSRRYLIEWYQRASVRTLGKIEKHWPPSNCVGDETLVAACLRSYPDGVQPMSDRKSRRYRAVLESAIVQPACNEAYRTLRQAAAEYVKSPDKQEYEEVPESDLDPKKQKSVAMRPGYSDLDEQQQAALDDLWGGFESMDALLDWLHGLNAPSNGEIGESFAESVVVDDIALGHLLYKPGTSKARTYREALAAARVLPAFVSGVTSMETEELAQTTQGAPTTLRMQRTNE